MKIIEKAIYHLILILVMGLVVVAQTNEVSTGFNIAEHFYTIPALAGAVLLLTGLIKNWMNITGAYSQYLSWAVSFVLSALGWLLKLGIFAETAWYFIFIYGLAAALIANGLFDWSVIKAILSALKLEPKKPIEIRIGG